MQPQTSKGSVVGVIILLLIIAGIFGSCASNDHTDKVGMVDAVRTQIQSGLLNPNGASFSSYDDTTMTKNSDGTYEIDGYVDDTNAFGAKVRNNFKAQVTIEDNGYNISYQLQNAVTGEWN